MPESHMPLLCAGRRMKPLSSELATRYSVLAKANCSSTELSRAIVKLVQQGTKESTNQLMGHCCCSKAHEISTNRMMGQGGCST